MTQELRIGLIGVGIMGCDHARNLAAGVAGARLTAVADYNERTAHEVAAECAADEVHRDGHELIASDGVDAVIIAAPDRFHPDLVADCLEHGKPVLCEKPLASSKTETADLIGKERAAGGRLITVGFMRRFDPGYVALRERLAGGEDGALLMTHNISRSKFDTTGTSDEDTVTNTVIHEIDIIPWLTGRPITRVAWTAGRASSLIATRHDPQFILMYDDSGALHTVEVQVNGEYGYDIRCEAVCERGTVELPRVPGLQEQIPLVVNRDRMTYATFATDWRPRFASAYKVELSRWVAACLRRSFPEGAATSEDALRAVLVAEALLASMRDGGAPVEVETFESALS